MVDEKQIEPHVALFGIPDRPSKNFTIKDFEYHKDRNVFTCPDGKELRQFRRNYKTPRSGISKDRPLKPG